MGKNRIRTNGVKRAFGQRKVVTGMQGKGKADPKVRKLKMQGKFQAKQIIDANKVQIRKQVFSGMKKKAAPLPSRRLPCGAKLPLSRHYCAMRSCCS